MTDLIEWQDRCSAYRQACRGKVASVSACGGSVEEWPVTYFKILFEARERDSGVACRPPRYGGY